ncbi:MAG: hypothetical protein RL434_3199 [Pseudomonadota bacterium]|jgi:hypothetical protein
MRRALFVAAVCGLASLCFVAAAQARGHLGWYGGYHSYGHHRHGTSLGLYFNDPFFWGGPRYGPYDPWYYDRPRTVIIERTPPVYIQRDAPGVGTPAGGLWYYCPSPAGYYPHVPRCNQQWVPVDPATLPPP